MPQGLKVLVTGSTTWVDPDPIEEVLEDCLAHDPSLKVLTGMADGADAIARSWGRRLAVPVLAEPLEPGDYPGPMHRYNERMLRWAPDLVLAFKHDLDLEGRPDAGTEHMCRIATAAGIPVHITR